MSTEYEPTLSICFYLHRDELKTTMLKDIEYDSKNVDEVLEDMIDEKLGLKTIVLRDSSKGDDEYCYCLKTHTKKTRQSRYLFLEELEEYKSVIDEKMKLFSVYKLTHGKPIIMASIFSY
jgi:prephenate dehydratase